MKRAEPRITKEVLELSDQLRPALLRLLRQMRRESGADDQGITPLHNLLLSTINDHPGIGVGELAQLEKLRGPTISGHIKAMEASGLLTRAAPDAADRRRVSLHVTERGQAMLDQLREQRRDWLARQLARLTHDQRAALNAAIAPLNEIGQ